jgi:hypothetical protein
MRCLAGRRMRIRLMRVARMLAAAATLLPVAVAAQEPAAVVAGRVVERGTGRPLPEASVALRAGVVRVTDAAGTFRFPPIRRGSYTLEVSALGYRTREIALNVRADTTLLVELEVAPLPIDPLEVRSRTVDVRGRVTDAAHDIPVRDAAVQVAAERVTTNGAGRFRVRRVPASEPAVVVVRAFGFLPASAQITPENDTTLAFALEEDPIASRMIEAVVAEIEIRSRAIPYARRHIGRADLLRRRNFPVGDLLRQMLGTRIRRVQCVMIDDVQRAFGMEQLDTYMPEELQYIEILDGGGMIRAYTRRYISRKLGPEVTLPPILLVKTPMGPLCR